MSISVAGSQLQDQISDSHIAERTEELRVLKDRYKALRENREKNVDARKKEKEKRKDFQECVYSCIDKPHAVFRERVLQYLRSWDERSKKSATVLEDLEAEGGK